ncbi:AAA family ATPase [Desulfopila sp. IMCC35008]|uniref:cytidylate kinase-like family protein n=1 Tax=Desulfopila sp. IMCC35008 TaxID=2653858 RepID=UPI0013D3B0EC|nr:cytidylate kinase-like family protein [Desulfopila sp. IMCC35008]
MTIVTISRGSYSRGKDVAEKLAQRLDYECVSRDILLEACAEFNIPEIKLVRALHDSPSVLDRFQHGRERFLSYFRYALLKHVQKGNIVYHGLAGHYTLKDLDHVLKVRIVANMDDRVQEEMKRENISADNALYILKKDDDERRKWGIHVHGTDTWDSRLYDIVLHIDMISIDDAVDILHGILNKGLFQITPESQKKLDDMVKSAKIHTMLVATSPRANVAVTDGRVFIRNIGEELKSDSDFRARMEDKIMQLDGVESVMIQEPLIAHGNSINPYYNQL